MSTQSKIIPIGFDFGTTQSTVAYHDFQSDGYLVALDKLNLPQYASILSFQKDKNKIVVVFGNPVKNNPSINLCVREVKRFIGKSFNEMTEMAEKLGMEIEEGENGECIFVISDPENDDQYRFTAEELIAIQIEHIKKIISERCKTADFSKVVITVPSSFNQEQVESLKYAYKLAGIEPFTIMKEPIAALNEYKKLTNKTVKKAIVIDIGGGTTDICICESNGPQIKVKTHGGESSLGGSDFDQIMIELIIEKMEENVPGIKRLFEKTVGENSKKKKERTIRCNKLKQEAEKAKIALSRDDYYQINVEYILSNYEEMNENIVISKEDFEEKIRESGLLEQIEFSIDECLDKINMKIKSIDTVILVGGTTKMPIVRQMISDKFGQNKIVENQDYDPLSAVSKGAARYSSTYSAGAVGDEDIISEIPESIGIEIAGDTMYFIAKKGAKTPINWQYTFKTTCDKQKMIKFELLKGESPFASSNEYVTEYVVDKLPEKNKGEVEVTFHVKIEQNGNMNMKAVCKAINQQPVERNVSCGFGQTDDNYERSLERIKPYFPV